MIIQAWLDSASRLKTISISDARVLLAAAMQVNKTWLTSHDQDPIPEHLFPKLDQSLTALTNGEPLPYLTGEQEFFGLRFSVDRQVLIPRPETELLVQLALDWLQSQSGEIHALDIGTGSGCIPVSILCNHDHVHFTATDISSDALQIAAKNAAAHQVQDRISFVQTDLCSDINLDDIQLICANLPYIPSEDLNELAVARFEPRSALDGGADGLELIRRLIKSIRDNLPVPFCVLLEIEYRQGRTIEQLAREAFPDSLIRLHLDMAGLPRTVQITREK